jgi:hypothetical protein
VLEIKMIGDNQTGKTSHAVGLAENWLSGGKSVLFVVPTAVYAHHLRRRLENNQNLMVIGCEQFNRAVREKSWDVIILDELIEFRCNPEGSYVEHARQRLRSKQFSVLAYTVPEDMRHWVSTSKWYKPWTWGTGYWSH